MNFVIGRSSWQPTITADTTTSSYWFNWRGLLCSTGVLFSLVVASVLISKYECPRKSTGGMSEREQKSPGVLYEDQVWRPCLSSIHPAWLIVYRVIAFMVLFLMLLLNVAVDGGEIFYYYTQWTFTLVTIYFGLGSVLSMYGCRKYYNEIKDRSHGAGFDFEHGTNVASRHVGRSNVSGGLKHLSIMEDHEDNDRQIAGLWGYVFQILFQMNGGAVLLTDSVFWFIIVPFLAIKDYSLDLIIISMHSINAVFLLGETALNSLSFPWFRIAYFLLWTSVYVIFQWIVHACISIWWPYPFLDLSSPLSPLWYSAVGLMHIPCYGVFMLIMRGKFIYFSFEERHEQNQKNNV